MSPLHGGATCSALKVCCLQRFIPQRDDSSNLHASYQLIPDGPGSSLGYVVGGVRTESDMSAAAAAADKARRKGANGEIDAMKGM